MIADPRPPWWLRAWLAVPDGVFRAVGFLAVVAYLAGRVPEYADWPAVGPMWRPVVAVSPAGTPIYGAPIHAPYAKVLVDLTFVLIGVGFAVRVPPRTRAATPARILLPLVVALWPLLPFLVRDALVALSLPGGEALDAMLSWNSLSWSAFVLGVALLVAGNALDVWGYATLLRSIAIVAEARELKTTGPYRWVRHPIYLGQFLAQAGVWLVLVESQAVWVVYYLAFVGMQLARSRIEDHVLAEAFGPAHAAFARRTWWFV